MNRTSRMSAAAAWAAPLYAQLQESRATPGTFKQTHKLPPMVCVLWLPDLGTYLRSYNALTGSFYVAPTADVASQLPEDLAHAIGQELADRAGIRVHLRPYQVQR